MLFHLGNMLRVGAHSEQTAMNLGVQGLDAPIQHLRKTGEFRDILYIHSGIAQKFGGAAGGENFNPMAGQYF